MSSAGIGCFTPNLNQDKILEELDANYSDVPKKYRRSLRKITMLNQ
jgi:hypothetical protein